MDEGIEYEKARELFRDKGKEKRTQGGIRLEGYIGRGAGGGRGKFVMRTNIYNTTTGSQDPGRIHAAEQNPAPLDLGAEAGEIVRTYGNFSGEVCRPAARNKSNDTGFRERLSRRRGRGSPREGYLGTVSSAGAEGGYILLSHRAARHWNGEGHMEGD